MTTSDSIRADERVGVVIPTIGRSELVQAIRSIEAQSVQPVSVVVVLDKPAVQSAVAAMVPENVIIQVTDHIGGAGARNVGTKVLLAANCTHVAYLDDDDWWEPQKLEVQLRELRSTGAKWGCTGILFHRSSGSVQKLPRRTEPPTMSRIVERRRLHYGDHIIQSSGVLVDVRTECVLWDESMPKHQDWDFAARLWSLHGPPAYTHQPLTHVIQGSAFSVSKSANPAASAHWLSKHRAGLTPRAASDFYACHVLRSTALVGKPADVAIAALRTLRLRPHLAAIIVGLSPLGGRVHRGVKRQLRRIDHGRESE